MKKKKIIKSVEGTGSGLGTGAIIGISIGGILLVGGIIVYNFVSSDSSGSGGGGGGGNGNSGHGNPNSGFGNSYFRFGNPNQSSNQITIDGILYKGLHNGPNACYLNSIFQAIHHCTTFREYIINIQFEENIDLNIHNFIEYNKVVLRYLINSSRTSFPYNSHYQLYNNFYNYLISVGSLRQGYQDSPLQLILAFTNILQQYYMLFNYNNYVMLGFYKRVFHIRDTSMTPDFVNAPLYQFNNQNNTNTVVTETNIYHRINFNQDTWPTNLQDALNHYSIRTLRSNANLVDTYGNNSTEIDYNHRDFGRFNNHYIYSINSDNYNQYVSSMRSFLQIESYNIQENYFILEINITSYTNDYRGREKIMNPFTLPNIEYINTLKYATITLDDKIFKLSSIVVHSGQSMDSGHYICVLPKVYISDTHVIKDDKYYMDLVKDGYSSINNTARPYLMFFEQI